MEKQCSRCHQIKPLESFSPSKNYKYGRASVCKVCHAAYIRTYRRNNPGKARAARQKALKHAKESGWYYAYVKAHHESIRKYHQEYNRQHAEERSRHAAAYYQKNKARFKARASVYYQKTKNVFDARNKQWRGEHPEEWKALLAKRRALQANAPVSDLTAQQWKSIKEAYRHCCIYCGKKSQRLTMDHITPLSKGGSHTYSNVVPACKSCNSKKRDGAVLCPIQPLLLLP